MFNRSHRTSKAAGAALLLTLAVFVFGTPASAYSNVLVTNTTKFVAHVKVSFAACRGDNLVINPGATSQPIKRGACLITRVTATLTGGPAVRAFESSGTSYSKVSIVTVGGQVIVEVGAK
jgi:hypothetical protein